MSSDMASVSSPPRQGESSQTKQKQNQVVTQSLRAKIGALARTSLLQPMLSVSPYAVISHTLLEDYPDNAPRGHYPGYGVTYHRTR